MSPEIPSVKDANLDTSLDTSLDTNLDIPLDTTLDDLKKDAILDDLKKYATLDDLKEYNSLIKIVNKGSGAVIFTKEIDWLWWQIFPKMEEISLDAKIPLEELKKMSDKAWNELYQQIFVLCSINYVLFKI